MLLISHFWHALLLANLLTLSFPPSNGDGAVIYQYCWKVEADQEYNNREKCEGEIGQGGNRTCGLDKQTGLGLGCVEDKDVATDCPPIPHRNFIYCGAAKYCCCLGNLCNGLYNDPNAKHQACEQPELEKSELCKPPISCLQPGKDVPEKCGTSPVGQPYCKLDPKTGAPLGCGDAYPVDEDECKALNPTNAMLMCNDKLCCCKGTPGVDNMPCNRLTMEACKIKELAGLDKCKDPTTLPMMNETHPVSGGSTTDATGGKVTPKTEDGNTGGWGSGIWNCCLLLFVMELALVYVL